MMRQRWGLGTVSGAFGITAALIAACSGNDIPPISNEDRDAFEDVYGDDDALGAAGAGRSGGAGAGGGGMVGRGGSGGGTPPVGGSGSGGSVVGGGGGGDAPCNAPVEIFATACAVSTGCHGAGAPTGDFAVSQAAAEAFVDVPSYYSPQCGLWIDSDNPEESLLLTKVNDTYDKDNCGPFRMPQSGDFLDAADEACILSWLNQFAN